MIWWFNSQIQTESQNQSACAPLLTEHFCATSIPGVDVRHWLCVIWFELNDINSQCSLVLRMSMHQISSVPPPLSFWLCRSDLLNSVVSPQVKSYEGEADSDKFQTCAAKIPPRSPWEMGLIDLGLAHGQLLWKVEGRRNKDGCMSRKKSSILVL